MKRLAILTLISIMLLCSFNAIAETTADSPILFRELEWGISLPEAMKGMPEGSRFYRMNTDSAYSTEGTMLGEHNKYFDGKVVGYVSAQSSSLEGIKIAGYELSGITLRFALTPGDDGMLIEDELHTKLYFAEYEISPKDLDAAYADLTTKLTSLYGEPSSTKESGFVITEKYTVWNGPANTMLVLLSKAYSSGSSDIEIRYGTKEGDEWLQAAYDALIRKETIEAASNVDGL